MLLFAIGMDPVVWLLIFAMRQKGTVQGVVGTMGLCGRLEGVSNGELPVA